MAIRRVWVRAAGNAATLQSQIEKYRSGISGPLMNRIDLHLDVPDVNYEQLADARRGESSATVRERVMQARTVQAVRYRETSTSAYDGMTRRQLEVFAQPSSASKKLLENAIAKMGLSTRVYDRNLKVTRTIADLEGTEVIDTTQVSEAIQYRNLDRPL